jgi:hypothetical protein
MARDILLNSDMEFNIINGDLVIGDADDQNLEHLALTNRGELKYDPFAGLDVVLLNKKRLPSVADLSNINRGLSLDNWRNPLVTRNNGIIEIRADREE